MITVNLNTVPLVEPAKVTSVYSGKPGCCCGCRGKHTDASWAPVKHPDRGRTINDRTVKMVVNKINTYLAGDHDPAVEVETVEGSHVAVMYPNRWYIAYFGD